jgi:hypothetical protein
MIDVEVDDLESDDFEDPTEDTSSYSAPYQEFDNQILESLTDAATRISETIANEFLLEIYLAATMLMNMCGDSDAFVAEQATTIRQNALVLATEVSKDPAELIVQVAQSIDDTQQRYRFVNRVVSQLADYEATLARLAREDELLEHRVLTVD